ncbi:EF-hand domain-containing family member C2 [Halyomorpha halys]|uniref:EF-hand domain-containing family member C2 n=1 Tax=Halyomorpha halys TaxID=286706 RepID=UPI0006D4E3FE|nr:EF-hand domain-containing family member C2-like [Halyomorpha halys]
MSRSPELPLIPGYSFNYNLGQTKFHKSQHFTRLDNEVPYLAEKLVPGIGGVPLPHIEIDEMPSVYAKGEVLDVPSWIVYDKQVLSFDAYYLESMIESGMFCNYMVRNCKIIYFLEDGTMKVVEKPVINSGLPQGVIMKRQKIKIPGMENKADFYGILDLNVGKEIELYGKVFKIINCDVFTRKFLNRLGISVPEGSTSPQDPYLNKRIEDIQKKKRKALKNRTVRNLLEMDNRILNFKAYWDDQDTEGGYVHLLRILYFLSDNTIEVKDVTDSEKSYFIIKRSKISKEGQMSISQPGDNEEVTLLNVLGPTVEKSRFVVDPLGLGLEEKEYYTDRDITIGSVICSYGRRFIIYDMDKFTKEYYAQKFGLDDLNPLEVPTNKEETEAIKRCKDTLEELPPHNGFGSFEDSAINCLYLIPSAYVKTWKRNTATEPVGYDSKILRFLARLVAERHQEEHARDFIISYYLEDNTLSVYEIPKDNSGITGGYIIKKRKIYKPGYSKFSSKPPEEMGLEDLFLGNTINLDNMIFFLHDIDEYSMKYMELHPNEFPKNNLRLIIDKLREGVKENYKQWAAQFFEQSELKPLPYYQFRNYLLRELGNKITEHEVLALGRYFKIPLSQKKESLENIRCLVHDELKRFLYDDFIRLEENFRHFDKEKSGLVSLRDAYITLRGAKLPLTPDFLDLLIEMLAKAQGRDDCTIVYCQLIDFLNYKKNPIPSVQRVGFSQIYEYEQLSSTTVDTRGSLIDIKKLLDLLKLEDDLKNKGQ